MPYWFPNATSTPKTQVTERNCFARTRYPTRRQYRERRLREFRFRGAQYHELNIAPSEDALMKANNDVTEVLRRAINLMQGELERSVLSTQMLGSQYQNPSFTSNLTS